MTQNQQNHQNGGENDEFRGLGRFQRNNTSIFKGTHDPDGVQTWLKGIDKIFRVMACIEVQKVQFGTHMLEEEAEDGWDNARHRMEIMDTKITWIVFRVVFMEKYFSEDVRGKKEIEFLELKQGNSSIAVYAEIKQGIGYQEVRQFPVLVNKCIIFYEDSRAKYSYYKNLSDKKGRNQDREKPYNVWMS
ncbi:uncharacterized protein LOC127103536 [Lathyrus oleraceus]|uniref:uncharacterized protein LOC127103536 n=1 Tax=Pisum sativum TaxID=3888 RepID=UPI0021D1005C|nr:uncharacterized protein LOC127103536 [Pisum sativum]